MKFLDKKRGFTLVEMLTTIVILGIVLAVAAVSITAVFNGIKKQALEEKAEVIEEAAILYGESVKEKVINSIYEYDDLPCKSIKVSELVPKYLDADTENGCLGLGNENATGCVIDPSSKNNYLDEMEVIIFYKNKRIYAKADINGNISCGNVIQDADINLLIDGKVSENPPVGTYKKLVDCESNNIFTYNERYQRLEIEKLTPPGKCDLNYLTDSNNYVNLKNMIENTSNHVIQGNEGIVKEKTLYPNDNYVSINKSEYLNVSMYTGAAANESGATASNAFTFTNGKWSSNLNVMVTDKFYHLKFNLPEKGMYKLCYSMPSTSGGYSTGNRMYVYRTNAINVLATYYSVESTKTDDSCIELGYLGTNDYVNITQRAHATIAPMTFYIVKATDIKENFAGYRYEGIDPDNYIWFNNELWRIIGSIPTCTSVGCTSKENLVKIIRNNPIGGIAYDAKNSDYEYRWGLNSLYKLLNNYYYGNKIATDTEYCYAYQNLAKTKCDYTNLGISNKKTDYYGRMIEKVYWNTGASTNGISAGTSYINETLNQTIGHIGLISASDYGYATSNAHNLNLNTYHTGNNNWLYQGYEYTLTFHKTIYNIMRVHPSGLISDNAVFYGRPIRPVVYLNSDVYIISGKGTINNPYIIGM